MKILLLGKDGQVGWELQRALAPLGLLAAFGRKGADFEAPESLRELVRSTNPDIIVNAAAYTAVDKAETDASRARAVNALAVEVLAQEASRSKAILVHYSTDYVFDGYGDGAYSETDPVGPRSVYGLSKQEGEQAIRNAGCRHLIFRTSWVYAARGGNFAKTMLKLAHEREELRVVGDQIGAPTSAELIADVTALCLYRIKFDRSLADFSGTYHLVAAGETSWHGYAKFVIEQARGKGAQLRTLPENIKAIDTTDYPLPAPRPANSRMNTNKLAKTFGIVLPDWRMHVSRLVSELITSESK